MALPEQEEKWVRPALGGLLLLWLLASAYILWPALFKITVPDESTFVYEGYRIFRGEIPYRDFFEFILPGTLYVVAVVYKLFGVTLAGLRAVALLFVLGCAGMTLYMAKAYLPRGWVLALAAFFWLLHIPGNVEVQHHMFSAFFGVAAVLCCWQALHQGCGETNHELAQLRARQRLNRWLMAGGFLAGVALLFTQSLGLALGMALMLFWLLYFWQASGKTLLQSACQSIMRVLLPAMVPIGLLCLYFASNNALADLWQSTFQWVLGGGYSHTTSHWFLLDGATRLAGYAKVLFRDFEPTVTTLFAVGAGWIPVLGLLWAAEYGFFRLKSGRWKLSSLQPRDWRLALLFASGLAFFAAAFSYPNTRLIAMHGWIPVLLAWIGLYTLTKRNFKAQKALCGLLVMFFACLFILEVNRATGMLQGPRVISYGTRERLLISTGTADYTEAYNQMIAFIREQAPPGKTLFAYNHLPELYLYTDRHNPTRYQLIMGLYNTPVQIQEVADTLRQAKPAVIVYNQVDALNFQFDLRFRNFRHFDYRLRPVEAELARDYVLAGQIGNTLVFSRQTRRN